MYGHNPWGGTLDMSMDSAHMTDHHEDNMISMEHIDKASLANLGHEDDQNHTYSTSWLLGPQLKNKKTKTKYVDLGCVVCSRKLLKIMVGSILATAIITGLVVMIAEFVPHHHSHALHPDNYTLALHKTLLFFNAQKCKNLHIRHWILHPGYGHKQMHKPQSEAEIVVFKNLTHIPIPR